MLNERWETLAPKIIYSSYPYACELVEPPKPGETILQFKGRSENVGDTLFAFLCCEACDDCENAEEYIRRCEQAIQDIISVQAAFDEE